MRIVTSILLGAALLAATPGDASAQRRFHFTFGGGPTFIASDLGERFSTGLGPAVGVTFDITERVAFEFQYAFRRFHAENYVSGIFGTFTGYHDTNELSFNLMFNLTGPDAPVRVYAVGGPGAYYRRVTITEYTGTGVICDPYWYVCGSYPITDIVGHRDSWDFGVNVGGGVGFKLGEDAEFTVESRFHWVKGPDIQVGPNAPAQPGKADGYYIPLTFGFRF